MVAEKRVWWISIGRFVLQTPRFWESLIGVDNYKGLFDEVSITTVSSSTVRISEAKPCKRNPFSLTILSCAFVKIKSGLQTQQFFCKRSIRFICPHQQITRTYVQCMPTNLQHDNYSVRPSTSGLILTTAHRIIRLSGFLFEVLL